METVTLLLLLGAIGWKPGLAIYRAISDHANATAHIQEAKDYASQFWALVKP